MVGWSRRNRESRERYRRWRSEQSKETLERHDLLRDIEDRAWGTGFAILTAIGVGCLVIGALLSR